MKTAVQSKWKKRLLPACAVCALLAAAIVFFANRNLGDSLELADNATMGVRLIDWEYAGMQDPHVDIAMFCIYSLYTRHQVDDLIDLYFLERCPEAIRIKIYAYIAVCGLLWSNWCEYKRKLGTDFGEYALRQYSFARDYEKIVREKIPGRR